MECIRNRSILLGWIMQGDAWIFTRETRQFWDVLIALLFIAQNVVKLSNVLTFRLASGVKSLPPAPSGTIAMLTLFWSTEQISKVYAHKTQGSQSLNVREDLGWTDHTLLK